MTNKQRKLLVGCWCADCMKSYGRIGHVDTSINTATVVGYVSEELREPVQLQLTPTTNHLRSKLYVAFS